LARKEGGEQKEKRKNSLSEKLKTPKSWFLVDYIRQPVWLKRGLGIVTLGVFVLFAFGTALLSKQGEICSDTLTTKKKVYQFDLQGAGRVRFCFFSFLAIFNE
jgi:hypothetical protein